jgi:hypothetical protein
MARNVFVVVLLLGAFGHCVAEEPETGQKPQYTRTRELPALKISFADMQSILEKAANLLSAANVNPPKEKKFYFRETLTLGKEPDEIEIAGHSFPATNHVYELRPRKITAEPIVSPMRCHSVLLWYMQFGGGIALSLQSQRPCPPSLSLGR